MKTKKNFSELLGLVAASISIIGVTALIVSLTINILFFKGQNQIWDSVGTFGALAFMLPFFVAQFLMPSGLLDRLGLQTTDIPFWGKAMFYLLVFPFANMWMLSATDAIFHFLPNFHEAMAQGNSRAIVTAMREQWFAQGWMIISATYASMIGAGLFFRGIFKNRLKANIA